MLSYRKKNYIAKKQILLRTVMYECPICDHKNKVKNDKTYEKEPCRLSFSYSN